MAKVVDAEKVYREAVAAAGQIYNEAAGHAHAAQRVGRIAAEIAKKIRDDALATAKKELDRWQR